MKLGLLVNINYALDTRPTQSEVEKAIDQLSSGKAHGADGIPAEVYKHGGPLMCVKAKASAAFGRLRSSVWDCEGVSLTSKIKVYRAVVLSTLLHLVRAYCGLRRLPQVDINYALDTLPTQSEVEKAIDQLSSGKAHGADGIPAEVYKHGGPLMREKAKASAAFGRLRSSVWDCEGVSLTSKIKVYRAVVLSTLLYASETWTVYQRHAKKLYGADGIPAEVYKHGCPLMREKVTELFQTMWAQEPSPETSKTPLSYIFIRRKGVVSHATITEKYHFSAPTASSRCTKKTKVMYHIDDDIDGRIAKASAAFGRLRSSELDSEGVSRQAKSKSIELLSSLHCSSPICSHLVRACCGLRSLPQVDINYALDTLPTQSEVEKAIDQLSSGKAHGADGIPAEVYKHGGPMMREKVTELFQTMWAQGTIPQNFKDASIVHLYKKKGSRQSRNNHRGISLLARMVLNRLSPTLSRDCYRKVRAD
ncbi:hypothetical protein EGW08_004033 [Elysia chlorotica]|uniref:Reverse transcriptase domain-containing protein n=1 Tax=Elysia chlorotica TaxID=188477 RepID=A0A433U311_ELYCH|nr:hypothetical protein EGW08_004033 [Elysia chlorotica]